MRLEDANLQNLINSNVCIIISFLGSCVQTFVMILITLTYIAKKNCDQYHFVTIKACFFYHRLARDQNL